jgi:hypothetical protein
MNPKRGLTRLAACLFALGAPSVLPAEWSGRLSLGAFQDSNVFESYRSGETDRYGRAWLDAGGRFSPLRNVSVGLGYAGGADLYARHGEESRLVNRLSASAEWRAAPAVSMGLEFQAKTKTFFLADRGYAAWRLSPALRWRARNWLIVRVSAGALGFEVRPGGAFDFRGTAAEAWLEASPLTRLRIGAGLSRTSTRFDREALSLRGDRAVESAWQGLGVDQEDVVTEAGFFLETFQWAFWKVRVSYETNRSNGYGYSYRDPRVEAVFSKRLPGGFNLNLFWTFREKTYTDPLEPFLQIRPDAEDETHSEALLDLSKRLSERWTARLRVAATRNESPFRNLYYRKETASLGCTVEL